MGQAVNGRPIRIADDVRERNALYQESRPDQLARAIGAGRDWLIDTARVAHTVDMSDRDVISLVHACFPGGWPAFTYSLEAGRCGVRDPEVIWLLLWDRYGLDYANRVYWQAC